ncbi:hypothetical protein NMG60_11012321 [Bertholletia excelsa]
MASASRNKLIRASTAIAGATSLFCIIGLVVLILFATVEDSSFTFSDEPAVRGNQFLDQPCEEIYVVREGETLHTISDKCGDPFILEENPHVQDPDDVFPGLVLKITSNPRKFLR